MTTAPREFAADAFILDAPGTYVSELQDGLIIGNRGQDFSLDSRVFQ